MHLGVSVLSVRCGGALLVQGLCLVVLPITDRGVGTEVSSYAVEIPNPL